MPIPRSLLASCALLPALAPALVINEVHFNPPENPVRQEFIELVNPGPAEVDLTGWRLSGAIDYSFPAGTRLAPGAFLVIAEDPATLRTTLRANALGPYLGSLDSDGETIRLRNATDTIIDLVDYKVGFPWPVAADGNGPSIELINPALDNSLGSSWRASPGLAPTPGASNRAFAPNAAPAVRKVTHSPGQPTSADSLLITALVTDPDGIDSVSLAYQVVAPGAYIPSHLPLPIASNDINLANPRSANPAYQTGWVTLPMSDDGTGGDLLANDGFFTATLPPQAHRTLLRYRLTVTDTLARTDRVPYPDDASLNFAAFFYDGVPDYEGIPAPELNKLPVYHLLTRGADYSQCLAYNSADQINQGSNARFLYNWNGTLVYDGIVYDNITYRLRGANGRYHETGKRSMRFRLNDGYQFQARDHSGRKYPLKWRTLTTGKGFDNRRTLTFGLNEAVSMYIFNKVGVPAPDTHWIHWRVIDAAAEAPDRWRGDFHGLNFVLETYDVRFLEAHRLEKGNLYKLINQTTDWERQLSYQSARGARSGRDLAAIENDLDGADTPAYIAANVNLDKWNRWHAIAEAIRHYDYWPSSNKNMAYYFEPDYTPQNNFNGKLWILPWDTDASWGPTWNEGHDVVYNALFEASGGGSDSFSNPTLWPAYFNMVREVRDLLWQRDQISPLLTEFSNQISPLERADSLRWKGAPSDAGNYNGLSGEGARSLRLLVADMNRFAFTGGTWPGGSVGTGGRAAYLDTLQGSRGEFSQLPATPILTYTGDPAFPTDGLSFASTPFSDPQGNHTFGAMQWRLAQVTDPTAPRPDPTARFKLEWEADWESGELTTFTPSLAVPTTAARSGLTYRARVRHRDNSGRWSHWSAPVQFTTTLPDLSSFLNGLVLSEIHYHPLDPTPAESAAGFANDDIFEWIELRNVGSVPINLTDVRLTKGIDFDFAGGAITSLAPGAFVLVVANRAAFETRYGPGLPIAGEWQPTDRLDNGGELVRLSFGAGDVIREFVYDDILPWPTEADGLGFSLVLLAPSNLPDPALVTSWAPSSVLHGTPGVADATLAGPFEAWLAAHGGTIPLAPFRSSSLPNLLAYALGADTTPTPELALPTITLVESGGESYPALRFRTRGTATDLRLTVEVSEDLLNWQHGDPVTHESADPVDNGDGTHTRTVRSLLPLSARPSQSMRLRVDLLPPE